MADRTDKRHGTDKGETREERLRAALRANLQRRKAQARARSDQSVQEDDQADRSDTGGEAS